MTQAENSKKTATRRQGKKANGASKTAANQGGKPRGKSAQAGKTGGNTGAPSWLAALVSVMGMGVAVGAGLYATRDKWMPKAGAWKDDFSAAFADDETDYENFDQTRHAGLDSMRDNPGDDWNDVDDMSDASFPASDPPSFTPGTAS